MLQFLKENSYSVVKCMLNQFAITLFGLMLAFATLQKETLLLLSSLFSIAFYMFLLYVMFWEIGGKDRISVDSGKCEKNLWKGFFISLTANLPNLILAVLLLCTKHAAETSETAGNIYFVANLLARGLEAMYLGLIQLYSPNNPICFLLIILPALVVCEGAYLIGYHNIRLLGLIGIQPSGKNAKR